VLVCDTSGLIAFLDRSETWHARVARAMEEDPGPFILSPYVLAEVDYLIASRLGVEAELLALEELTGPAWELAHLDRSDLRRARDVVDRYRDQDIGLADASIAVLAHRYGTRRLLTLDDRHFRVVRAIDGKPFELLPGKAPPP
jgi:predicted nucleic acid-binding protein